MAAHRYRETTTTRRIGWWFVNLFLFSRHRGEHRMRYGAWTVDDVAASITWSPFNCLGDLRRGLFEREGWVLVGAMKEGEGPQWR
jgi:hypothetical protein